MAIYISGVKGLPEQVQENKENIKAIQDEIEGIDFEAIRELEEQVAENTEDINNLEGSVGVQNIAISDHEERLDTLEPKVSALETKTSQIAYVEDNDSTNIGTSVKIYGNGKIEARQLDALDTHYKDAEISNGESGIYLVQDGLTSVRIFNSHSGTTHTLDFKDDGTLEVDGNDIQDISNLYDSQGHKRFIEDNINTEVVSGISFTYKKWSLSGTHLMIVLGGRIDPNTTIASSVVFADISLPSYIFNKIYNTYGSYIETKTFYARDDGWTETKNLSVVLGKLTNVLRLRTVSSITSVAELGFRIQYDLLIDNE